MVSLNTKKKAITLADVQQKKLVFFLQSMISVGVQPLSREDMATLAWLKKDEGSIGPALTGILTEVTSISGHGSRKKNSFFSLRGGN